MRAWTASAALAILLLSACGKYGPPLRPAEAARARERAEERERARSGADRSGKDTAPGANGATPGEEARDE